MYCPFVIFRRLAPAVLFAALAVPVWADPTMTISSSLVSADFSPLYPGHELRITYTVTNVSAASSQYDMMDLTLPAGLHQLLFGFSLDGGLANWQATVGGDALYLDGAGSPLAASGVGQVVMYFHNRLPTTAASAVATARGLTEPVSFPSVIVTVPSTPLGGDANQDGRLTLDDYLAIDTGYRSHGTTWETGDFNLDGAVTLADYPIIDATYAGQGAANGAAAELMPVVWESGADAAVPEPGSLGFLGLGMAALLRRRWRRGAGVGREPWQPGRGLR